jgi:hypothetical protein
VLHTVPCQLLLFSDLRLHTWLPSPSGQMRENRSASEWIDSVIAYCEWRAGLPWKRIRSREDRWHPERWDYLGAAILARKAFYSDPDAARLHVAAPVLNPAPPPFPDELRLAGLSRKALVKALVAENPKFTDPRAMRFTRRKLARMLCETRAAVAVAEPERMRA